MICSPCDNSLNNPKLFITRRAYYFESSFILSLAYYTSIGSMTYGSSPSVLKDNSFPLRIS